MLNRNLFNIPIPSQNSVNSAREAISKIVEDPEGKAAIDEGMCAESRVKIMSLYIELELDEPTVLEAVKCGSSNDVVLAIFGTLNDEHRSEVLQLAKEMAGNNRVKAPK